ncbi:MAG: alpha/beta fold hydrolase [Nitrospirae bacterium]|nr:MAG: alpha/beta fold hydrolase [Nitrospirota bacterium]
MNSTTTSLRTPVGIHQTLESLPHPGGGRIPVRAWTSRSSTRTPVVILHGLQSHAGWFTHSAEYLAQSGFSVYAMDRRGSGLSREARGHCTDFHDLIREVEVAVRHSAHSHHVSQVHLLGHCFGAILALAYACTFPKNVRSLVLATPGLFTRIGLPLRTILNVLLAHACGRTINVSIPLAPAMFSELDAYASFIADDPLALHEMTGSFVVQCFKARRFIRRHSSRLSVPIMVCCAGLDEISDNAKTRRWFDAVPAISKVLIEYPKAKHLLEFSGHQQDFFADLRWWFQRHNGT